MSLLDKPEITNQSNNPFLSIWIINIFRSRLCEMESTLKIVELIEIMILCAVAVIMKRKILNGDFLNVHLRPSTGTIIRQPVLIQVCIGVHNN